MLTRAALYQLAYLTLSWEEVVSLASATSALRSDAITPTRGVFKGLAQSELSVGAQISGAEIPPEE